jgi:ABC-type multidrug transport system fused ATPase/permease subunit
MRVWLWMLSYLRVAKGTYIAALLLMVVSVFSNLGILYVQQRFIDDVFMKRQDELFLKLLLVFVVMVAIYIASWCMKDILFERASDRLRLKMRSDYMQYLYSMPMAAFRNERTGAFVSHLQAFIQSKDAYIWQIPGLLERLLNLLLTLAIVSTLLPKLLIVILPVSVLYIVQGKYFQKRIAPLSIERNNMLAAHNTAVEEGIASTREVAAFHQSAWEREKLARTFSAYMVSVLRMNRLDRSQIIVSEPLRWIGNLAVIGFGGYAVISGHLSIGVFVLLYQLAIQLIDSIHGVYHSVLTFSASHGGLQHAQQLIGGETISDGFEPIKDEIGDVYFKDVRFTYLAAVEPALRGTTLTIPAGNKVAIVGGSGSGKSTLAQLLVRFEEPEQGSIAAGGLALKDIRRDSWAHRCAVVFQDPYLFPDTIRSNILLGRSLTEQELHHMCRIAEIHDFIMELPHGYDTPIGERGITLSGGQRQRIAIARSLAGRPEVLILDEATSALDQETERRLFANLDRERSGMTTIVIAHRLATIQNADLIFVIENGRVVDSGRHTELLNRVGRYAELYQASAS